MSVHSSCIHGMIVCVTDCGEFDALRAERGNKQDSENMDDIVSQEGWLMVPVMTGYGFTPSPPHTQT